MYTQFLPRPAKKESYVPKSNMFSPELHKSYFLYIHKQINQADYLLLYEQNWPKTEAMVLKKTSWIK